MTTPQRIATIFLAASSAALADTSIGPPSRDVQLTYTATIKNVPESARAIDLWLPVAQDTDAQVVSQVTVAYPEGGAIAAEPQYGNKIWHKRFEAPFAPQLREGALGAQIVFVIHRDELVVQAAKSLADNPKGAGDLAAYLRENRLIPIAIDPVANTARDLKLSGEPPIRAARKTYDWLIKEFTYNWKAPGAGIGDVRWACDSKTGDCSDYHSMFIALMRNQGIAADHEFGFPIRTTALEGRIPSYHCWARFYAQGAGWIPLDASEADKHPELHEYNFGSQSANLFKFTHGRDVDLVPKQAGPPLNKFIEPYAEVDGVEVLDAGVELVVTFKVLGE
jgi:transglutaminase-like putative cysteine protease